MLVDAEEVAVLLGESTPYSYYAYLDLLKTIPPVNAEPVTRCRYCKHQDIKDEGGFFICKKTGAYMCDDDFCNYGEGKESKTEEARGSKIKERKEREEEREKKELAKSFERWIKGQTNHITEIRELQNKSGCAVFGVSKEYQHGNQFYLDIPMYYVWRKDGLLFETIDCEKAYKIWKLARRGNEDE